MFWSRKHGSRRAEVRKNRPDCWATVFQEWKSRGIFGSIGIAALFFVGATAIVMLRENMVPYRPGQYVQEDVRARVPFTFNDPEKLNKSRNDARESASHVYARVHEDVWAEFEKSLIDLPDRLAGLRFEDVPLDLREAPLRLQPSENTEFQGLTASRLREQYAKRVDDYVNEIRNLVIIPAEQYREEMSSVTRHAVMVPAMQSDPKSREDIYPAPIGANALGGASGDKTGGSAGLTDQVIDDGAVNPLVSGTAKLQQKIRRFATRHFSGAPFSTPLDLFILHYTLRNLAPTFALDPQETVKAQNTAGDAIGVTKGQTNYSPNDVLVPREGILTDTQWQLLRRENEAYILSLGVRVWKPKLGLALTVLLLTVVLAIYIGYFQPRIVRNHTRAFAIAGLLLAMLLLAILSAVGKAPLYIFGVAPTILVAMILAIAYDQRFAMGVASMRGILVATAAAPAAQGIGFFLILWVGVLTCCFLLDEVRTRSKLIEVGGLTALAMIAATIAAGAMMFDPIRFIANNCLYTAAAGLAVGFVVLGILPFIEKMFHITTSMTLLELADASQPLLRRLALEAPGTYNHSLQVATLAETAAEAIHANSLLCRVASYYHDIGKINKPDYFIENQSNGPNRHLNLSPSVSLLIIIGHVKDGVALGREYNLPPVIFPFIQQHHGTTLVEYFYHRACTQDRGPERDARDTRDTRDHSREMHRESQPAISETQYRYPGPKPNRKETAIVMLADAVESATRAMTEPTASRIEALVHELAMKRLLDGQFDECELTMRDLEQLEKALVKTLLGIYHGRIAYPSTAKLSAAPAAPTVVAAGA